MMSFASSKMVRDLHLMEESEKTVHGVSNVYEKVELAFCKKLFLTFCHKKNSEGRIRGLWVACNMQSQGWCRILHLSHGLFRSKGKPIKLLKHVSQFYDLIIQRGRRKKGTHFNEGGGGTAATQVGKPKGGGENSTPKDWRRHHPHATGKHDNG